MTSDQQEHGDEFNGPADRPPSLSKTRVFVLVSSLSLLISIVVIVIMWQMEAISSNPHIAFALFLGIFFTIALGVTLMALVFYSARSGHDDAASE